jgi:O-acetylhomoserine/O-acetylserine sulfhydrylase-like pyridoxal-dependent enzyme
MTDDVPGFTTRAIHAGDEANTTRAVATPVYQTATYRFETADEGADMFAGRVPGHVYSRWSNPNVAELEAKIAALEGAGDAVATASGMAAISTAPSGATRPCAYPSPELGGGARRLIKGRQEGRGPVRSDRPDPEMLSETVLSALRKRRLGDTWLVLRPHRG